MESPTIFKYRGFIEYQKDLPEKGEQGDVYLVKYDLNGNLFKGFWYEDGMKDFVRDDKMG